MKQETTKLKPTVTLDLRNIACPLNFVKTKIQLEKMQVGDVLEVLLDDNEATRSVPPGIIEEGHKVIAQEKIDNYFKILIEKSC